MIFHVHPVAYVHSVTVHRQRLVPQRAGDHQRNELFGELVRPVVVGAARNQRGQLEGLAVRAYQQIGRRLARRIWAIARDRRSLAERWVVGPERAVDLVGADMEKPERARPGSQLRATRFEQRERSLDVRFHENTGTHNRPIHVRLGGEVRDGIGTRRRLTL